MGIWFTLLLVAHVFICVFLILLVLVQNDKGGGLAGAFGGMGGGAALSGSSAVNVITKLTTWLAAASFVVLIALNVLATRSHRAVQNDSQLKAARTGLSESLNSSREVAPIPGLGGAGSESGPSSAPIPGLGGESP
jgi:preprotein translocase subunit SecG